MKKLLTALFILIGFNLMAQQPTNYTPINSKYKLTAGAFDSALHIPTGCGYPSLLTTYSWKGGAAIYADTCNNKLYFYRDTAWVFIPDSSYLISSSTDSLFGLQDNTASANRSFNTNGFFINIKGDGTGSTVLGASADAVGDSSIALGGTAIAPTTNGVSIGASAGRGSTGTGGIYLGKNAGTNSTGNTSIYIGTSAGNGSTSANSVIIGTNAGLSQTGSLDVTGVGKNAARQNTGARVTAIGADAGWAGTGNDASFLGHSAGEDNTGDFAIGIGSNSAFANTGDSIIAIGANTGNGNSYQSVLLLGNAAAANKNYQAVLGGTDIIETILAGKVGIGTSSPAASSILDLTSTSKGFLAPRMTAAQRAAISSPATGLMVFDTDTTKPAWYNGSAWVFPASTTQVGGGGGVTSFTDGNGFDGTVTGSALSLTTTVPDTRILYSNSGALGSSANFVWDGSTFYAAPNSDVNFEVYSGGNPMGYQLTSSNNLFYGANATTNTITNVIKRQLTTSGSVADGFGISDEFHLESSSGTVRLANSFTSKWKTATDGSRESEFDIGGVDNASTEVFMNIQKDLVRINNNADTLATKAYARSVGGSGGISASQLTDSLNYYWRLTGNHVTPGTLTGSFLGSTNNASVRFRTNNTEKAVLDSNGRLGIATTAPTFLFETAENNTNTTTAGWKLANAGNGDAVIHFLQNTSNYSIGIDQSNSSRFYISANATLGTNNGLIVASDGKVGLNGGAPAAGVTFGAGASGAFSAPVKYTSGTLQATAEAGTREYNGNHYATKENAVRYGLAGSLKVNTTAVGNVGTGVDDLITYSVPAGTLGTNGDYIEFEMTFTFAANANNKEVKVLFGATTLYASGAQAQNTGTLVVKGKIIRTGATSQVADVMYSTDGTLFTDGANYTTPAETLSGAITLKATGEATSNDDISQKSLVVRYFPNN